MFSGLAVFAFVGGYWLSRRRIFQRDLLRIQTLEIELQPLLDAYQALQITPQQRELVNALLHKRAEISNLTGRL